MTTWEKWSKIIIIKKLGVLILKVLYIECNMGAAGDMLMSALSEIHPDPEGFIEKLNSLNIPKVEFKRERLLRCGIAGTHISVLADGVCENENMYEHVHSHNHEHVHSHDHEHAHSHDHEHVHSHNHEHAHSHEHAHAHSHTGMKEIGHIISHIDIPDNVKKDVLAVYNLIAEAESHVHGRRTDQIHFHEVGTMDAVADIVGVCMLIDEIKPDRIISSPVCTGYGTVKCAHGVLPVPAPATAYILRDIPVYSGNTEDELCTPTGAALLRYFADKFEFMPVMSVSKIGYGMGTKDFAEANCVRVMLGEMESAAESICELCCNIDDMTAEEIGFAVGMLMDSGAADTFTVPVYMKKNRPAVMLTCLCRMDEREKFVRLIFKYTSTIGIRERISGRYTLKREMVNLKTGYGNVKAKVSWGYGVKKIKPEYDDVEKLARENDTGIDDIKRVIEKEI